MPGKLVHSGSKQNERNIVAAAAQKYNFSPAILWGVYGTETGFGANLGPSSAGAQGPFQFMPATARQYHVNVGDFTSSAFGAAHLLHDLGITHDVNRALNNYNGNGGGSSETSYSRSVKQNAQHWTGGNPNGITGVAGVSGNAGPGLTTGIPGDTGAPLAGIIPNPVAGVDTLIGIITDPTKLAGLASDAFAWWLRLVWGAMWKYVVAPPVHKSQRAALFYWEDILSGKKHFGKKDDPYAWAIPSTLAFWSLGAYLLWGRSGDGPVNPMNKHRSTPLGKALRHLWDSGNKRKLHAPKEVKKHTPPKPTPHKSWTLIEEVRTVSVARRRPVTVTEGGRQLGRGSKTARSEEPIEQVGTTSVEPTPHAQAGDEHGKTGGGTQSPSGNHAKENEGKRKEHATT